MPGRSISARRFRAVRRWGAELSAEERAFVIGHSWNEIYALIASGYASSQPPAA